MANTSRLLFMILITIYQLYKRTRSLLSRTYNAMLSFFLSSSSKELILHDISTLSKLPSHIAIILDSPSPRGLEALVNDCASIAGWCLVMGIPVLSIYEARGEMKGLNESLARAVKREGRRYFRDGKRVRVLSVGEGGGGGGDGGEGIHDGDFDQDRPCLSPVSAFPPPHPHPSPSSSSRSGSVLLGGGGAVVTRGLSGSPLNGANIQGPGSEPLNRGETSVGICDLEINLVSEEHGREALIDLTKSLSSLVSNTSSKGDGVLESAVNGQIAMNGLAKNGRDARNGRDAKTGREREKGGGGAGDGGFGKRYSSLSPPRQSPLSRFPAHSPSHHSQSHSQSYLQSHLQPSSRPHTSSFAAEAERDKKTQSQTDTNRFTASDISIPFLDAQITSSLLGEPNLVLVFSAKPVLQGFPPWSLRLCEICWSRSRGRVCYRGFLGGLRRFGRAEMRWGR